MTETPTPDNTPDVESLYSRAAKAAEEARDSDDAATNLLPRRDAAIRALVAAGHPKSGVATRLGLSVTMIHKILDRDDPLPELDGDPAVVADQTQALIDTYRAKAKAARDDVRDPAIQALTVEHGQATGAVAARIGESAATVSRLKAKALP